MLSCPRVLDFELMVVEWAIKVLQKHAKTQLMKRSSLEEDLEALDKTSNQEPFDWQLFTIIKSNVSAKQIFSSHLKMLRVLKAILTRMKGIPSG